MSGVKDQQLPPGAKIRDAMAAIERSRAKIVLVVAETGRLVGTVTDGDIRRGFLRGESPESPVATVMNPRFIALPAEDRHRAQAVMATELIQQIPLLDVEGRVVDIELLGEPEPAPGMDHVVIIMAGGEGKRMRPLTEVTPKPMLRVGGRPMLETIISNFTRAGFLNFVLSVNYRAETIKAHFGDGSRHGVSIRYLEEPEPRGTAGALRLLDPRPEKTMIIVNGDVLTNLNFANLLHFHHDNNALISLAVQRYRHTIPLGVVEVEGEFITSIREKPTLEYFVNAGIYALEPAAIDAIPDGVPFDMPSLIQTALAHGENVAAFPIHEYWIDVGHAADFTRATMEYDSVFG